jgi:hypothetical protein
VKHLRRLPSGDLFNIRSVDPISRAFILANAQEADRAALASWVDSVPPLGSDASPEAPSHQQWLRSLTRDDAVQWKPMLMDHWEDGIFHQLHADGHVRVSAGGRAIVTLPPERVRIPVWPAAVDPTHEKHTCRLLVVPEHLLSIGYSPTSAFGQLMAVIEAFNAEVSK